MEDQIAGKPRQPKLSAKDVFGYSTEFGIMAIPSFDKFRFRQRSERAMLNSHA